MKFSKKLSVEYSVLGIKFNFYQTFLLIWFVSQLSQSTRVFNKSPLAVSHEFAAFFKITPNNDIITKE